MAKRSIIKTTFLLLTALISFGVACPAVEYPKLTHICTVAPDIIAITVRDGHIKYGAQLHYDKRRGDKIELVGNKDRVVFRDGKLIGFLAGPAGDILHTPDKLVGGKLKAKLLSDRGGWLLSSTDDPRFASPTSPEKVHRKSYPVDLGRIEIWGFKGPSEHVVYLRLPRPLQSGCSYQISAPQAILPDQVFRYRPRTCRSEAVHVSQIGFRPDDPAKLAFLSCWMGDGGALSYAPVLPFQVLRKGVTTPVYHGLARLSKAANDKTEDAYKANYNGTDVYQLDFSGLQQPGSYCVYVEGIGCSFPFKISKDTWRDAFYISARGFYHQRSGIKLGPPYTDYKRPRGFHPADGVKVYASTAMLVDTGNGLNEKDTNFGKLVGGKTDEIVPDAWGGYMDAGDWDRRIQHLDASRLLLELALLFPDYFSRLSLNIPESDNNLPDVIDEALFNLDHYRRMQTAQGGIRGGVESAEHPRHGEASWQESLEVIAYAPGPWSSYYYVGVAARAALVLEKIDAGLAKLYRASALKAMSWAEDQLLAKAAKRRYPYHQVRDQRNLAAVELYRLTGDERWHKIFIETTIYNKPDLDMFVWKKYQQREAGWVYLRIFRPNVDTARKKYCLSALRKEADQRASLSDKTGFKWTKFPYMPPAWGAFSSPDAVSQLRVYHITGEERYLRAAVLACQCGAGANPLNMCFTTGLGQRWPVHALHVDSRISGQRVPPGYTVGGPIDVAYQKKIGANWAYDLVKPYLHPRGKKWPGLEAYWDVYWHPPMCEFTVHNPMARNAYVWGYLAARL